MFKSDVESRMLHWTKRIKLKTLQWPELETSYKNVNFHLHKSYHGISFPFVFAGDLI